MRALNAPSVKEQFVRQGVEAVGSTPAEFAALLRAEYEQWGKVIKATGLKDVPSYAIRTGDNRGNRELNNAFLR